MLIKALRLRYLGHRIPVDELRLEVPMVGMLRYEDQPHGQSSMVCLLMPVGGSTESLVQIAIGAGPCLSPSVPGLAF